MKPIIPIIITLFSVSLNAQEAPTPTKPHPAEKVLQETKGEASKPSATSSKRRKVVLPPSANSSTGAATNKAPTQRTTSSRSNERRVVLPPNAASSTGTAANRPPTRSTSSSRSGGRSVVIPSSARPTSRPPISRPSPNVTSGSGSVRRVSTSHTRPAPPTGLQENLTIQLNGTTGTGEAIDLALTGIGPIFQSDVGIGKDDAILTQTYSVTPQGSNYLVEFSIGTRIKIVTSTNGPNKSFQYRDNTISGKVLLEIGKPVTVSNNQGKSLALTVLKP